MERRYFTNISTRAWEHPADRAALAALKQVPGLNEVIKFLIGLTGEKSLRFLFLSSSVRVSEKQFPEMHNMLEEACRVLDAPEVPELYVTQNPVLNAGAIGVKKPFIVVNSSILKTLDSKETLGVVAHELAHILSGHVLYKTLLWLLVNLSILFLQIPVSAVILQGIIAALREWDRKSELSSDRAGLLVTQEPAEAYTTLMKLAGGGDIEQMNIDEIFAQAEEYDRGGDLLDGVTKLFNLIGQSHPFPVLRLREIHHWAEDGEYGAILDGTYARRDQEEQADIRKEFDEASKAYQEDFDRSEDPLAKAMSNVSKGFENVRKDAEKIFNDIFSRKE